MKNIELSLNQGRGEAGDQNSASCIIERGLMGLEAQLEVRMKAERLDSHIIACEQAFNVR
jgi:hypothetical protein